MRTLNKKIATYIIVVGLVVINIYCANAQKVELGARFMPTFTSFNINTPNNGRIKGDFSFGYGVEALVGFNFTEHIGIQGEVMYNSISQKYKEDSYERKINLRYINIPILLSLNTGKTKPVNLNFVAGPQIGFSIGGDIKSDNSNGVNNTAAVLEVKKGDLGFAYGAGLDFGLNPKRTFRLGFGFRGVAGLIDISDDSKTVVNPNYYILDRTRIMTYAGYIGLSILL